MSYTLDSYVILNKIRTNVIIENMNKQMCHRRCNNMRRTNVKVTKRYHFSIRTIAIICIIAIIFYICLINILSNEYKRELAEGGFLPIQVVMEKCGYKESSNYVFQKNDNEVNITISYDFDLAQCNKNQYKFDISDAFICVDSEYYLHSNMLESILNWNIEYGKGKIRAEPVVYMQHEWSEKFSNVIAHAGGAVRDSDGATYYTNSLDALVQNYNLGHRVFEFDFNLTSDNQLALVHDWEQFGNCNGVAMFADEWKSFQTFGSPVTDGRYETMMIDELLDQMLVNKDIFIVTDTKSFEISEDEMIRQFQIIYDEAMKRDAEILNRIIPQIYNEQMYYIISDIYKFPSVIYTLYATESTAEEVISFTKNSDVINIVTAPVGDARLDVLIEGLHDEGKLIYVHTIQTYSDLTTYTAEGIDGFYTGLLLPKDYEICMELSRG